MPVFNVIASIFISILIIGFFSEVLEDHNRRFRGSGPTLYCPAPSR